MRYLVVINTVAFCNQLSKQAEKDWITELSGLKGLINVIPFCQLTSSQKKKVKVAIVANPDPKELTELTNLEWVQSLWSGVERLVAELPNKNIKIVRMKDPKLSQTMAEAVLAWTLYLHRDMPKYRNQQSNKHWQAHKLIDISNRQIGILGLGALGIASANKLLENGFQVSGWSRSPSKLKDITSFHGKQGFIKLLKKTDILISLLPLTNETTNLLNKETLTLLPKHASLINFSRGPIINEDDLLYCLKNERLKHAVLDVFSTEPLPENHPFWSSKNITVLPHISAPTDTKTASALVVFNISKYFETGMIPNTVNLKNGY